MASNFFVPQVNSIDRTTFYYTAIQDWNLLPVFIKEQTTFLGFKRKVKHFLASRTSRREQDDFICIT